MLPPVGVSSKTRQRARLDLPDPEGPRRANVCPSRRSKETPLSATVSVRSVANVLRRRYPRDKSRTESNACEGSVWLNASVLIQKTLDAPLLFYLLRKRAQVFTLWYPLRTTGRE